MKMNFLATISRLNRAKRIELDHSLVIPPHGPVGFRFPSVLLEIPRSHMIDDHIHRQSGSIMSLKVCKA